MAWGLGTDITEDTLKWAQMVYGVESRSRINDWKNLIAESANKDETTKLETINSFFNKLRFIDDQSNWHKKDYWATPQEFIAIGAGDCEDFSLAKYFTLMAVGVDESKLRLTYVKSLRLNQPHMVLAYFKSKDAIPLVLDNLDPIIKPATERSDLVPIYSFNGDGLWVARERGEGKLAGSSSRLQLWKDLLSRLGDQPALPVTPK